MRHKNGPKPNLEKRALLRQALDNHWRLYHYPPTIRDLLRTSGYQSTSAVYHAIRDLEGVRIVNGKPVPRWVDEALYESGKGCE